MLGGLAGFKVTILQVVSEPEDVTVRSNLRYCPSMAECILSERDETGYSTIVVGRQGLSRSEEFLLGSISSMIVSRARNCTVWVVE
ncbi:MAG: universal stress protein [Deltaproteobacteria bacterium]|nr:universal stress protein [Deltaproteobacteria bacterium]